MRREAHTVYLSSQAMKIIMDMKKLALNDEGLIFPGITNPYKPISSSTLMENMNSMGYEGKATIHGFRSMLETFGAELMCFNKDALDKVLSHKDSDTTRDIYHQARYVEERQRIMTWWGAWLEAIEMSGELVPEENYIPESVHGGGAMSCKHLY